MLYFREQDQQWRRLPVDLICALRDLIYTVLYRAERGDALEGLGDRVMLWSQTTVFSKLPEYLQEPTQALVFSFEQQQASPLPLFVDTDREIHHWRERAAEWAPILQASGAVYGGYQQLLQEADAYLATAQIRAEILLLLIEGRTLFPEDVALTNEIVQEDLASMGAAQANIRRLLENNNSRPALF